MSFHIGMDRITGHLLLSIQIPEKLQALHAIPSSIRTWERGASLSNFADVMVNMSNLAEPANGGGSGATETYFILRPGIDLNELSHSRVFHKGPLRDVVFEFGANLETKNSSYAPSEKTIYIGPKLEFALPKGFFNVGLHFRKEWNHEECWVNPRATIRTSTSSLRGCCHSKSTRLTWRSAGTRITTPLRERIPSEARQFLNFWFGVLYRLMLVPSCFASRKCSM